MSLFPQTIDNSYRGRKVALWIFGLVVAMRTLQSLFILFNGYNTVTNADGVPLATYPPAAAQTILALFALSSVARLIISFIGIVALVRYRRAIPFMFVVLGLSYLGAQVLTWFIPLVRVGRPPGTIVNLTLFALTLIGLVLSLWRRRDAD